VNSADSVICHCRLEELTVGCVEELCVPPVHIREDGKLCMADIADDVEPDPVSAPTSEPPRAEC
jgi:hypothetical protein